MIASLKGLLQHLGTDQAVVEVHGVGYLVQISAKTRDALDRARDSIAEVAAGAPVFLFVETHVREDAIILYGFATEAERSWFRLLGSVQGVGGKVALGLLSSFLPDDLARAITLEDKAMVSRAQGVGPRLAARIVTELKGKTAPGLGSALTPAITTVPAAASPASDAISALANLGFREPEAQRAVAEAQRDLGSDLPTATLIREALKRASR